MKVNGKKTDSVCETGKHKRGSNGMSMRERRINEV